VRAKQKLAVDDGVKAGVVRKLGRAPSIPAAAMPFFRVHRLILAGSDVVGTSYNVPMAMCGGPPGPNDKPITNKSGRVVKCVKFQKDLPGLDAAPWPGEIGQRIYENVSAQAWKLWEDRQKMILNEYRLMPWQKEGQELIRSQMEDFFFGEGSALPPDYVPQQTK
jgi:Fe-S cluster biosynthesis and repair protein YggX